MTQHKQITMPEIAVRRLLNHAQHPGKLANGLHFLALDELRLKGFKLGRIAKDRDKNDLALLNRTA